MALMGFAPDSLTGQGLGSWLGLAIGVTIGTGLAALVWPTIESNFSGMFGRGKA